MKEDIQKILSEPLEKTVSIKLSLTSSSENLKFIRRLIVANTKQINFSKEDIEGIKLATIEACTNVIKHAHNYDIQKSFDLEINVNKKGIIIKIVYNDPEFKPEKIPVRNLDEIREGGYGVFLMRKLMDYINYETDIKTGNVCLQMVKFAVINQDKIVGGSCENRK